MAKFHNPGFTLDVNLYNCRPNFKRVAVLFVHIQVMLMEIHRHTGQTYKNTVMESHQTYIIFLFCQLLTNLITYFTILSKTHTQGPIS